ncbi:MAG: 16S rRNA (adenine(1518)-N(6)/adenine(1519)-N(6))-dimethyltransferase RsmA [Eubacterium sp.]|nr:16S rRNA (adenine(1518)-N(6)/adenine(1519)-N(6))-dimethyltransferase RsmA [Eubacterium sp.]
MEKLTSPKTIEAILNRYGLHFNKRFGQNFLIDDNIVNKIVEAGQVTKDDVVLEIGPGIGTMTRVLSEHAGKVYTVEIDKKLIPVLRETLADCDNVTVVEGDILKTDVAALLAKDLETASLKIVANLPYYVTTPIIMGFLESALPVERMTFLIQKEVGERLCAEPGTKAYGSLTIAAAFYAEMEISFYVPATVFMPRPRVDSIVVTLTKRDEPPAALVDKALFFKVVRAAFQSRRKTLINSMSSAMDCPKEVLLSAMAQADIDPAIRGEKLTGEDFARLANALAEGLGR